MAVLLDVWSRNLNENKRLNILGSNENIMQTSTFKLFAIVVLQPRFFRLARAQWDPQLFLEF